MAFHKYGQTVKFPRNEDVEIHVREVTLNVDQRQEVPAIEIREFLRNGEVYGHGLVLPARAIKDLKIALDRVVPTQ